MIRTLYSHPASSKQSQLWHVAIRIESDEKTLGLAYRIQGDSTQLEIPKRATSPTRMDDLWQATCCEIFLRRQDQPCRYLELNFSPSGHWALYRFNDYRKDQERPAVSDSPLITTLIQDNEMVLEAKISWRMIKSHLPGASGFDTGLSAVLKERSGTVSYWAAKHPVEKPDFHHPDSFFAL